MLKLVREVSGIGFVSSVNKRDVYVTPLAAGPYISEPLPKKSCKAGCGSCGGCAILENGHAKPFRVCVENPENYKIGDRVAVNYFVPPVIAGIMSFWLPIAMVIAAISLWLVYAPEKAGSPIAAISIPTALFCGIIAVSIIDYRFRKRYPTTFVHVNDVAEGEKFSASINTDGNAKEQIL